MLFYKKEAKIPLEALPLGNSHIGAMVFGGTVQERIVLNDDMLWSGNKRDTINYRAKSHLETARKLIAAGEIQKAQHIIEENMLGVWSESYMPLGDMYINFRNINAVEDYSMKLDFSTATSIVEYSSNGVKYQRRTYVSFPDDVMVTELCADGGTLDFELNFSSQLRVKVSTENERLVLRGIAPDHVEPNYVIDSVNPVDYSKQKGVRFTSTAKIIADGGEVSYLEKSVAVTGAQKCVIIYSSATSMSDEDYEDICMASVTSAAQRYKDLYTRHTDDYSSLYNRVDFKLESDKDETPTNLRLADLRRGATDNGLISTMYNYGRYLLLCSGRSGFPSNLQGIWNWDMRPAWSANLTTNINIQMNYWHSENANMGECGEALADWMLTIVPEAERVARIHYGARGYCMHHNVDAWGMCTPSSGIARYAFWPFAGVWICEQIFEHFSYTNDMQYLEKKAMPLIEGSVLFCLDWMHKDENGEYITSPSTSPENTFHIDGTDEEISICEISVSDFLLIHRLFSNYITACKALGKKGSIYNEVRQRIKELRPIAIDDDGTLLEWGIRRREHDEGHRHFSHLMGIYPGTYELNDEILCAAAKKSFEKRLRSGGGLLGWSAAWASALFARFKDTDNAKLYAENILKRCAADNLFDVYLQSDEQPETRRKDEWDYSSINRGWFQIDGNFGFTTAVTEMLLQDCSGYIELLPCLPAAWGNGRICGLRAKNDITVDQYFENGVLVSFRITVGDKYDSSKPVIIRYRNEEITLNTNSAKEFNGYYENNKINIK